MVLYSPVKDIHIGRAKRLGLGASFIPSDIDSSILEMWIDATDEATVTLNSGAISQIDDKSGNDRHATQVTVSIQPDYIDGSAGYKAIDLSTPSDGRIFLGDTTLGTDCTLYIVMKESETSFIPLSVPTSKYVAVCQQGNSSTTMFNGSGTLSYYKNGSIESPSTRGDLYDLYGGDNLVIFEIRDFDTTTWTSDWNFGYYSSTFNQNGEGYEIIALNSNATGEDRLKIQGYLAHKYGLESELPLAHPYRTAAPTTATPAWTPLALSPTIWINPQEASSVTLNGTDVSNITNYVSNGYGDIEQSNASQQPPYNTSDSNVDNYKSVDTNGLPNSQYGLEFGSDINIQSYFFVGTYKDGTDSSFDGFNALLKQLASNSSRVVGNSGSDTLLGSGQFSTSVEVNGTNVGTTVLPMPLSILHGESATVVTGQYGWMMDGASASRNWEGSGCSLIIFDRALTTDEKDQVTGYLAHQFGLEGDLPGAHPYKDNPPTY
jgi:hypothetical protein